MYGMGVVGGILTERLSQGFDHGLVPFSFEGSKDLMIPNRNHL